MKRIIFLGLSFLALTIFEAKADFRALLIGINYQDADASIRRLYGCVNDVNDMKAFMTDTLGIPAASIRTLTEAQATRKQILAQFQEWLIHGTKPGDVVFFQYSGHGVQIPDPFGTQADDPFKQSKPGDQKFAEAFVPFDTLVNPSTQKIQNLILDSEFNLLLNQLADRKVYLFLDCCHSEGITRDFHRIKAPNRYLHLPWDPTQSRFEIPDDFPDQAKHVSTRGITRRKPQTLNYNFFAAVKYFQSAYEYPLYYGRNGLFTYSVLNLLRSNPQIQYTNTNVLDYARNFIHHKVGISQAIQEPVFHGVKGEDNRPFILLTQGNASAMPEPKPPETVHTSKTAVWVTGQPDNVLNQVKQALSQTDFAVLDENKPDVIVEIKHSGAEIYHAVGRSLKTLPAESDLVQKILTALEGIHIVRELSALENPSAPFTVEIWMDEIGKKQFKTGDKVTLYYRIKEMPQQSKAWLTLINVAPDGTFSILYPQKADFHQGPGEKLYLNAEVTPGKTYSIPKTQADLKQGQYMAMDLRIRLEAGQEYFKAIVTSEPIDWDKMDIGEFRSRFKGMQAKKIAVTVGEQIRGALFWSVGDLRVEVRP